MYVYIYKRNREREKELQRKMLVDISPLELHISRGNSVLAVESLPRQIFLAAQIQKVFQQFQ